jgi:hypothetical protein
MSISIMPSSILHIYVDKITFINKMVIVHQLEVLPETKTSQYNR